MKNGQKLGALPKNGRGIVIHSDYFLTHDGISTNSDRWSDEIHSWILYWDHIIHPVNDAIWVERNPVDNRFLVSERILSKPCLSVNHFGDSRGIAEGLADFYLKLDQSEPGSWCISESTSAAIAFSNRVIPKKGTLIQLYNAIPVPSLDCPLEDIVRFRHNRKDEIVDLSIELDRLYQNIVSAGDSDWALQSAIREVEKKCCDAIRVSKESRLPFRLANAKLSVSAPIGAILGSLAGATFGMPGLGAIVGSAFAPSLTIGLDAALAGRKPQADVFPYRFAASLHNAPL